MFINLFLIAIVVVIEHVLANQARISKSLKWLLTLLLAAIAVFLAYKSSMEAERTTMILEKKLDSLGVEYNRIARVVTTPLDKKFNGGHVVFTKQDTLWKSQVVNSGQMLGTVYANVKKIKGSYYEIGIAQDYLALLNTSGTVNVVQSIQGSCLIDMSKPGVKFMMNSVIMGEKKSPSSNEYIYLTPFIMPISGGQGAFVFGSHYLSEQDLEKAKKMRENLRNELALSYTPIYIGSHN